MSGNYLYQDMTLKQRLIHLQKLCIRKETTTYTRTLSEDELAQEKDTYAREGMEIATLKDEKSALNKTFAEKIKKIEETQGKRLTRIANGKKEGTDELYLIPDESTGKILYVDKLGEIIMNRPMNQNEKQGRLFLNDGQVSPDIIVSGEAPNGPVQDAEFEHMEDAAPSEKKPDEWLTAWKKRLSEMPEGERDVLNYGEEYTATLAARVQQLIDLGFKFDEYGYKRDEGDKGGMIISHAGYQDMTDEEWAEYVETIEPLEELVADAALTAGEIMDRINYLKEKGFKIQHGGTYELNHGGAIIHVTKGDIEDLNQDEWENTTVAEIEEVLTRPPLEKKKRTKKKE